MVRAAVRRRGPSASGVSHARAVADKVEARAVAVSVRSAGPGCAQPLAQPETCRLCPAADAAQARGQGAACRPAACGQAGAPVQAVTRRSGSAASVIRPGIAGSVVAPDEEQHPPRRRAELMAKGGEGAQASRPASGRRRAATSAPSAMQPGLRAAAAARRACRCSPAARRPARSAPPCGPARRSRRHVATNQSAMRDGVLRPDRVTGWPSGQPSGAQDQPPVRAALHPDIGRGGAQDRARRRYPAQSRTCRQARHPGQRAVRRGAQGAVASSASQNGRDDQVAQRFRLDIRVDQPMRAKVVDQRADAPASVTPRSCRFARADRSMIPLPCASAACADRQRLRRRSGAPSGGRTGRQPVARLHRAARRRGTSP